MNKKIVLLVTALFIVSLCGSLGCDKSYARELKIGYVDPGQIMDQYKKAKDAITGLREKGKVKEDDMRKMIEEVNKLKEEQALLSDKAKGEKQKVIDNKIKTFQEYKMKSRDEMLREESSLMNGVFKEVGDAIAKYGKDKGYDMILHKRVLLYGADKHDLTSEILKRLEK